MSRTGRIVEEIFLERRRQDEKFGVQTLEDGLDKESIGNTGTVIEIFGRNRVSVEDGGEGVQTYNIGVLLEEVGEVMSTTNDTDLRKELIQVAAVAAKWVEQIDRRNEKVTPLANGGKL